MRFEQQISAVSASLSLGCARRPVPVRFRPPVSASGQTPAPAPAALTQAEPASRAAGAVPGTAVPDSRVDEAVRMALENNLGIQAERLSPQMQTLGVAQTRAAYAPTARRQLHDKNSNTQPAAGLPDRQRSVAHQRQLHDQRRRRSSCCQWGGGRYQASLDGAREHTTSDPTHPFNPQLVVEFQRNLHAAAAAQLHDRQHRGSSCCSARSSRRSPTCSCSSSSRRPSRTVRNAYYDLVGRDRPARGRAGVARPRARVAEEQPEPGRGRHDCADRHRRGAGGSRRATKKR